MDKSEGLILEHELLASAGTFVHIAGPRWWVNWYQWWLVDVQEREHRGGCHSEYPSLWRVGVCVPVIETLTRHFEEMVIARD